eukprot:1161454-Pelagomonas_calceolata.AAC.6
MCVYLGVPAHLKRSSCLFGCACTIGTGFVSIWVCLHNWNRIYVSWVSLAHGLLGSSPREWVDNLHGSLSAIVIQDACSAAIAKCRTMHARMHSHFGARTKANVDDKGSRRRLSSQNPEAV